MKLKNKSLRFKIWIYLAIFSSFILLLLWVCQGLFFDKYYEIKKSKELSKIADKLMSSYSTRDFTDVLDEISFDKGICVEVIADGKSYYNSSGYNKGCIIDRNGSAQYKSDFVNSGKTKESYKLINKKFNNETLIYGIKLEEGVYAYVNASLVPLDSATILLKQQLIIITIIVLCLSVVVAYYISKNISKPIEKLSLNANEVSNGNYQDNFTADTDIEEIKQLENNLNYMKNEFVKTDELRSDLLANVSHDLKTPLTMIKAYAEMVRDLTYNDGQKRNENLNVIINESERLNGLVNDILTLSSIQSKTKELELKEFSLDSLIKSILRQYDILIEQEKYSFIYQNNTSDTNVVADYKRIEQVIYNILNNAINYTGEDKLIYITVSDLGNTYRVDIKDTGKGIDKEEIKNIWNKYYHSEKKHKRNLVGTGLGLSIVKNILEQHNFNYGVESEKGKGTTFYFEILKSNK